MNFNHTEKVKEYQARLSEFMEEYIYPNEKVYKEQIDKNEPFSKVPQIMEELKEKKKGFGICFYLRANTVKV